MTAPKSPFEVHDEAGKRNNKGSSDGTPIGNVLPVNQPGVTKKNCHPEPTTKARSENIWIGAKGFGFIRGNVDGQTTKYFVHQSNIKTGSPQTGAACTFDAGRNSQGLVATNVAVGGAS